jgi:hypothetical protein
VSFPDGYHLVVKRDCQTCTLIEPVVRALAETQHSGLSIYVQDDPNYLRDLEQTRNDTALEKSFFLDVETVPTLIRYENGVEAERVVGWVREEWREVMRLDGLGEDLPEFRPGCGSLSVSPGAEERLRAKYGDVPMTSRTIEIGDFDDDIEQGYDRGWSDGLPIVPPTGERVLRMLSGTTLDSQTVIGRIPPNLTECTVEKVAINAVMAGCKPEYMPVVLAAIDAALDPLATLHGLLCTTCFSAPIIIVNGPIAKEIGMNWGINALGQGNRANSTIGRALQLVVRNVGGGIPGEIDRATLGNPGKIGFCFPEDETDPTWQPLSESCGFAKGANTVTIFAGDGVHGFVDNRSRTPEELTKSFAMALQGCLHPKLAESVQAVLVLSPEHYAIYRDEGWERARITDEIVKATIKPGKDLIRGAHGIGEGIDPSRSDEMVPKFAKGDLMIVRAGGAAGLFSGILTSWTGTQYKGECAPVTREIKL